MQETVNFIADGLGLTPTEFARVLQSCTETGSIELDAYSLGGTVAAAEEKFADLLGKERAIFMPTGTMANFMALREQAGAQRKVIVQAESHIYKDIGDSAQTLSGLNLIPLGWGRPGFSLEEVQTVIESFANERVATGFGVISIESLVRRFDDAMFDGEQMRQICTWAREQGIRTHLDGARLFVEAVHRGVTPAQQADLFDTVFVSLSKCFNCASGAVLAGPAQLIEGLYHRRRMFGGSLPQAWPQAAVALHYADGFTEAYTAAWEQAQAVLDALDNEDAFRVEYIEHGTHIVRLHVVGATVAKLRTGLRDRGVLLPPVEATDTSVLLKINPSILRQSATELIDAFREAVRAAA